MRLILRILTSRISNKIILPYLLLALFLAIAMSFVAVRLTTGALQDRLDNRLIEAAQVTSDGLIAAEDQQIEQLRGMAFTEGVPAALSSRDPARLAELLRPHWATAGLSTLIAFDAAGAPVLSWRRASGAGVGAPPEQMPADGLSAWWVVQQITGEREDVFGDKFSIFRDGRLYTAAPVRQNGRLVGGLMVGIPLDALLERLQSSSQASVTTFYDAGGRAVATTQILAGDSLIPAIPLDALRQLVAQRAEDGPLHIQSVLALNGREYQLAYSPLEVRRAMNGFFAVGLPRQAIVDTWAAERAPLAALALLVVAAVVGVGLVVSRGITRPLSDLVGAARAVAAGELRRRSSVSSRDELGVVARSFNQMTERLLHLYETSRALSAHTQIGAILDQAGAAIQPLAPGTLALALLEQPDGWRFASGDHAPEAVRALQHSLIADGEAIAALAKQAERPLVAPVGGRYQRLLALPPGYAEACYIALSVQGRAIGLLLLLHERAGAFDESVREPLAAIGSMAATALYNARLYLEVEAEGNRRRAILESIADAVLVCDAARNVALMNPSAETLLGVRDWSLRRYHFDELPLMPVIETSALRAADGRIQARYQVNGRVVRASNAVLSTSAEALAGEVIVLHNITDEVALDQAKTDLIALISHELRTPLTAIQSAADMLRKGIGGQMSALQNELADTALRQSQAMSVMIDKAIMVASIEAGTLELDAQSTDLSLVVRSIAGELRAAAGLAEVELAIDLPADLPLVQADAHMLKVALRQVIDNAIKYGAGAPLRIAAQGHAGGVELAVRDHGPGIAAADLPNLFRPLRRGAGSLNAAPRGIGLGLVIARELIERQGGTIGVQSQLGQGALFKIFLPGATDAAPALAA
jgi:signal transduction histidine kinase